MLKRALPVYDDMLAPANTPDAAWLFGEMTRAMALLGGGWSAAQRGEWIQHSTELLADLPFWLVKTAFPNVFHKVSYASEVVKWIYAYIEEDLVKYRNERSNLDRTIMLAVRGAQRAAQDAGEEVA